MDQSAPNQFRTALNYLLTQEGRGAQTRLADEQKIDRGYLNAIVRGRKSGSEKKRSQIAAHFDILYEDMLTLGRRILDGEENPTLEKNGETELKSEDYFGTDKQKNGLIDFKKVPRHGKGKENIPDRIVRAIEVLGSDTEYADLLAGMIDAFYDTVSTKKENLALKNKLKEMESRIASLEERPDCEKGYARKSA